MTEDGHDQATYRFDPHDEGIWMGLGLLRLSCVCGALLVGAVSVYGGHLGLALLLILGVPPVVLARWDGLPLVTWIPLRLAYHLRGPREWSTDPERIGFVTPAPVPLAPSPDTPTDPTDEDDDDHDAR